MVSFGKVAQTVLWRVYFITIHDDDSDCDDDDDGGEEEEEEEEEKIVHGTPD